MPHQEVGLAQQAEGLERGEERARVYPAHADPATRPLESFAPRALPRTGSLILGLFAPNTSFYEWPSTAPTSTEWTYDYNRRVAREAERIGFSFFLPQGRWKGLEGDEIIWRGASLDTVTLTAGLLEATERIVILTTIHTNVFNPVVAAKLGADLDQIGQGRFGLNIVSGWGVHEFEQMGVALLDHKARYDYTREWLRIVRGLWEHGEFSLEGQYFTIKDAVAFPRPVQSPSPVTVNAGQSYTGMRFSAENVDYVFSYGARAPEFAKIANDVGRDVGFIGTKRLVIGSSDADAQARAALICAGLDKAAIRSQVIAAGNSTEAEVLAQFDKDEKYQDFLLQDAFVGSAETIADRLLDWTLEYQPDGVCLILHDCLEDLALLEERTLPRLKAGLERAGRELALPGTA